MTRKRLLKLKDEYQEISGRLQRLNQHLSKASHISLAEMNLEAMQVDILQSYLDCLKARIELARGKEK